jgi:Type ISP C-terminal specificity domain
LKNRWGLLAKADPKDRPALFKLDVHRNINSRPAPLPNRPKPTPSTLAEINADTPCPPLVRYAYRSFDRQWLIADSRLITTPTPDLWAAYSDKQIFLTTQKRFPLSNGPGITASACIPDYDYFMGRGGAVLPLWLDHDATEPNVKASLLKYLATLYDSPVAGYDFFAYVAATLGHSGYTTRYEEELTEPGPRVPITRDRDIFFAAVELGKEILWLHTFGERFFEETSGRPKATVPQGHAKMTMPISNDEAGMPIQCLYSSSSEILKVGYGEFAPIAPNIWNYSVSGMKVVSKWLGYRMKNPRGKKSSPLESITTSSWPAEWTTELLQLLWVLERLVDLEPAQATMLESIANGHLVTTKELGISSSSAKSLKTRKKRSRAVDQIDLLETS